MLGTRHIDDVLTFYVTTTRFDTGAGTDADSVPSYRVYEEETGTAILTGTMALLDNSNTAGFYSEQITLSAANGFEVGKSYSIFITATVNSVAGVTHQDFVVRKKPLTPTTEGRELDVTTGGEAGIDWANVGSPTTTLNLSGTTVKTATDVEADTQDIQSRLPTALVSGRIDSSVGAMASGVVTATAVADGAIDRATFAADTGLQSIRSNTAQAGAAGTVTLDASASATDDIYNDAWVYLTGGTGAGQVRLITDYVGSSKVASVAPNWATNPDSSSTFAILPVGRVDVATWLGSAPNALSSGRVDASVGAMANDVVTAAAIAADAIGSSELAASAVTEIQTGLSTLDAAGVRSAVGLASANLDTQLDALPTAAENADAVWDEALSGHVTSGTFGQRLAALRTGTAQAGASGSVTLDASASAVDDFYKNALIVITGGTGANQARTISGYTGSSKVATITPNWGTNPSSDSVFVIVPMGAIAGASAPTAGEVADAVWDEARSGHVSAGSFGEYTPANVSHFGGTAGTFASGRPEVNATHLAGSAIDQSGGLINANVKQISGDATAADNAESFFDGTGYAGTGNVIPTVTTLTNAPPDSAGVTTLLSRIPAALFSGITSLAQWLGLLGGKQTGNSTARTELRATGAGSGTFDETTDSLEAVRDNMGTAQTGDSFARLGAPAGASVSADIAAVQADTDNIQTRLPASLVSGRIDASVGAMAADVVTASAIATDAIGANELAASAITEIQAGMSTLDAAGVRSAVGLASANLDTQLSTIDDFLDTEVAAIKAKTDQLVFTTANRVDSTVVDKTGFSLSSAGIQAIWDALTSALTTAGSIGKLLVDNINATVSSRLASASYTTPPTATENADALLTRDMSAVTGEAARSPLNALRPSRNKFGIVAGTLTVYKEDDTTPAWTAAVTETPGDPVTEVDPA